MASQEEELVLPYPPLLQQWCPPAPDIFKVNFDVAVFRSSNLAGLGVIVHDSSGAVVGALFVPISLGCLVAELEALACLRAVQFALEIGLTKVVLEGDSVAVLMLFGMGRVSSPAMGMFLMIFEFKFLLFQFFLF